MTAPRFLASFSIALLLLVGSASRGLGQASAELSDGTTLPSSPVPGPEAPPVFSAPPRVALVTPAGSSPSLDRWLRALRDDLSMVDDVRVVSRAPQLQIAGVVALEEGRRVLHVSLRDAPSEATTGPARYEQAFDLGPLDARRPVLEESARHAAHVSADAVLETLTGRRGGFDSNLVFARRVARRRKDIFRIDSDGLGLWRVSSGHSNAMLPAIAHGDVWYSVVDSSGLFLTRAGLGERPALGADEGLTMGVQPCGERIVFSTTRDGDAEIYSATPALDDLHRLTFDEGIDVSPSCGPSGHLAFVSNRSGSPRIHVLFPGDLYPRRVEQPDTQNQTPVFCMDPEQQLLAFTQIERGRMSVWTLSLDGGAATRVSPPGGRYKDPAFSPDCRLLAYVGPEGIWVSSLDGRHRRLTVRGAAETVRWGRLAPLAPAPPPDEGPAPDPRVAHEAPPAPTPAASASSASVGRASGGRKQ